MPTLFLETGVGNAGQVAIVIAAAAFAGALLASTLGVPKIAGYLVVGAIVGPAGLDWISDPDRTRFAAELGVAMLIFVVGVELSLRELLHNLRASLLIAGGQFLVVGALVGLGALALDVGGGGAFVLGGAAGLSSTAAGLALVVSLGRARQIAPVAVGVLIAQDIVAVILIGVVPSLTTGEADELAVAVFRVLLFVGLAVPVVPIAAWLAGIVFRFVAVRVDRELFVIGLMATIAILAAGAVQLGLSVALGAFVAGLVVSQSGYSQSAIRETEALRDVFAAAFFVSAGLLFDPDALAAEPGLAGLLVAGTVVVKFGAIALLARLAGLDWGIAVALGVLLANIGEFSFVVVSVADEAVVSADAQGVVVFTVAVSLLVTAGLTALGGRRERLDGVPDGDAVVLVGYGRLGRRVAEELRARNVPLVVVERDPVLAALARRDGYPAIWADAGQRATIKRLGGGRVFVVTDGNVQTANAFIERLAMLAPNARVVTLTAPEEKLASLGLDLTIVDADRAASLNVAQAVQEARARPVEPFTVRSHGTRIRFPYNRGAIRQPLRERLFNALLSPPVRTSDSCAACNGRGRRFVNGTFTRCTVCGGDGRRSSA
ncbi:MAG: monovalent cation:proton antiporter family protein [Dehalococcoidia bacterium]